MTFEDLEAWQQARQLVNAVYALTRSGELVKAFRLCSQIQAAVLLPTFPPFCGRLLGVRVAA